MYMMTSGGDKWYKVHAVLDITAFDLQTSHLKDDVVMLLCRFSLSILLILNTDF